MSFGVEVIDTESYVKRVGRRMENGVGCDCDWRRTCRSCCDSRDSGCGEKGAAVGSGAGSFIRGTGLVVVRRIVPGGFARAATNGNKGLKGAGLAGLAGDCRVRPLGG